MYRSSRLRSTLNTKAITGLDMCKVCTEAVDCVALLRQNIQKRHDSRGTCGDVTKTCHACVKIDKNSAFTMGTRTCFSRVYMQLGPKTRQAPRTQMYQRKLRQHALFQKHTKTTHDVVQYFGHMNKDLTQFLQ